MFYFILKILIISIIFTSTSYAYLGPGLGGGVIAATLGIVVAIFAAIFGILWFPIKRILNKKKIKKKILINHLLIIFISIIIYEFLRFFNFKNLLLKNINIYKEYFNIFNDKNYTDLDKEKLIFKYSKNLLLSSLKILFFILIIILFIFFLNKIFLSIFEIIFSILGIIEITISLLIYHLLRSKLNESL